MNNALMVLRKTLTRLWCHANSFLHLQHHPYGNDPCTVTSVSRRNLFFVSRLRFQLSSVFPSQLKLPPHCSSQRVPRSNHTNTRPTSRVSVPGFNR